MRWDDEVAACAECHGKHGEHLWHIRRLTEERRRAADPVGELIKRLERDIGAREQESWQENRW